MGLTLADMRGRVVENLGGEATEDYAVNMSETVLNGIVNEALHAIEAEADWPWLLTTETIATVAGTAAYTPTAGWYRSKSLFMPDWGELTLVSVADLNDAWPTTDRAGPVIWTERGGQIVLAPVPDAVYSLTHTYWRTEPDLLDDGDEPLMANQFRGRIVDMATAMAGSRLYRPDGRMAFLIQRHEAKDAGWRQRMQDDRRRTVGTKRIRIRRDGPWARSGV